MIDYMREYQRVLQTTIDNIRDYNRLCNYMGHYKWLSVTHRDYQHYDQRQWEIIRDYEWLPVACRNYYTISDCQWLLVTTRNYETLWENIRDAYLEPIYKRLIDYQRL